MLPDLAHERSGESGGNSLPLRVTYTEPAEAEIADAYIRLNPMLSYSRYNLYEAKWYRCNSSVFLLVNKATMQKEELCWSI